MTKTMHSLLRLSYILHLLAAVNAWTNPSILSRGTSSPLTSTPSSSSSSSSRRQGYNIERAKKRTTMILHMGLLDSLFDGSFLNQRQNDFIKLEDTDGEFGPGPAIIMYNVPDSIETEEFIDMLADGAPKASAKGISLRRINTMIFEDTDKTDNNLLDLTLEEALIQIVAQKSKQRTGGETKTDDSSTTTTTSTADQFMTPVIDKNIKSSSSPVPVPVVLFSGFSNPEMMESYNIIGGEIYQETGGQSNTACAKAVPNAMQKPLRQVFEEISGDHMDAISSVPEADPESDSDSESESESS